MNAYKMYNRYTNRKGYRVNETVLFIPEEEIICIERTSLTDIKTTPNIIRKFKDRYITRNVMAFYLKTFEHILAFAYDRNLDYKKITKQL